MKNTILLDADLKNADLRGAFLSGALLRGAEIDGANLAGAEMHGATGLSAGQICSAHWQDALLDAEVLNETQARCGTTGANANASRPTPQVNASPIAAETVVVTPVPAADGSKQSSVQQGASSQGDTVAQTSLKPAAEKSVAVKPKHNDLVKAKESSVAQTASSATKTKQKSSAPENPKTKTGTAAATASAPQ
jgi:hypothetical protein